MIPTFTWDMPRKSTGFNSTPPPLLSLNGAYVISMAFVDISSDQRSIVGLKVEWVEQMSITQRQAALSVHYTGPSITKTRGEKWGNQR